MNADSLERFTHTLFDPESDMEHCVQHVWEYQYEHNPILRQYCDGLARRERTFLPIEFFKDFALKTGDGWEAAWVFESSGTTGQVPSRHFVKDTSLYKQSALQGFFHFYPKQNYRILALLPSYLERGNSSLVQMVNMWIEEFGTAGSGFFLNDFEALIDSAKEGEKKEEQILLIGVSFALLDLAEIFPGNLPKGSIVMETGGMKGRRKEMVREELHDHLCSGLGVPHIASEYGMTELLSQAYALQNGRFRTPPWMQVHIRDPHLSSLPKARGKTGRIHIIDLVNLHSCAFIATDDIGRMHPDGSFEVLGRIDHAELRGCNLMYEI